MIYVSLICLFFSQFQFSIIIFWTISFVHIEKQYVCLPHLLLIKRPLTTLSFTKVSKHTWYKLPHLLSSLMVSNKMESSLPHTTIKGASYFTAHFISRYFEQRLYNFYTHFLNNLCININISSIYNIRIIYSKWYN